MLPIHKTLKAAYDYDDIPAGYYYQAMLEGPPVQRFWHRRKFEAVAERVSDGSKLVDFGCSAGSFLHVLGEVKTGVRAVGVDIGAAQIEFAREHVATRFPDGRVTFEALTDTSGKLPFDDESVDFVTSIEVVEHLHPAIVHRFFAEARRVLKKSGRLIVTTPNYRSMWPLIELAVERMSPVRYAHQHINKFTPNSLTKVIEGAGFEVTEASTLFVVAPFLAGASAAVANALHGVENAAPHGLGSLLLMQARPMGDDELGVG